MGRRRATGVPVVEPVGVQRAPGAASPGARVAWSYLGAIVAAVVTGLGLAITDAIGAGVCASDDVTCSLGVVILGGSISAIVGIAVAALALGLGWEWIALNVAAVVALPTLLDLLGPVAWGVLAIAPLAAGLATWTADRRPPWRPWVIAGAALVVIVASLAWTFFPPG